jgi:hypothetical protein
MYNYVCSYFKKDETECSQAIVNAAKEAKSSNMNVRDGLKKIGAAFLSKWLITWTGPARLTGLKNVTKIFLGAQNEF